MAEYIKRDIFINNKLIPLVKRLDLCHPKQKKGVLMAIQELNNEPAVDVVEVVRCKDCKWYQEGNLLAPNKFCFRLEHPTEDRKIGYNYAPDDFCSYGEKRSDTE